MFCSKMFSMRQGVLLFLWIFLTYKSVEGTMSHVVYVLEYNSGAKFQ